MEIIKLKVGTLKTNCYLLISLGEAVVIDPGGDEELILATLEKYQAKLLYLINTHYHFDHTDGNDWLKQKTGARILIHQAEEKFINFQPDIFLTTGDEIKFGEEKLGVIHTPGHTAGGICLLGKGVIFTGDTLFKGTFGRTDLAGGSEEEMKKSLEMLSKIITKGMHVYPGHGHDYIN
ncbi:MAG: MBL fold metallo-hydrolase [Candidatus Falkowbacteria bacterium]|nr:MBL fold metallo-hydrolase [Candidatus Falkowbacteria bacterium]